MTTRQILLWIHINLRSSIEKAITDSKAKHPSHPYTRDWLAGITYRETGVLINKYASVNTKPEIMHALMRGDYSQRKGEKEASHHGFGYTQIDIASYPEFVKSGAWKDPYKCFTKAIEVLEEKRSYLQEHFPSLPIEQRDRAITAAYNCGQGNVAKVLTASLDIDTRTADHNYSLDIWQRRQQYRQLLLELGN